MDKLRELAHIAVGQWGLVTSGQARSVGVSAQVMAKMARTGDIERLAHGVYRLAGNPLHQHDDLRVAWLALQPDQTAETRIAEPAVDAVSHRSAAQMRGLGDIDADMLEFTVVRRRQTRRSDVRLHRAPLPRGDWTLIEGLPVTIAERTIADLAAARVDRGHLAGIVRDALASRQSFEDNLARVLARHARGYGGRFGDGRRLLKVLLEEAGGLPDQSPVSRILGVSPFETALAKAARTTFADPEFQRRVASFMPSLDVFSSPEFLATAMPNIRKLYESETKKLAGSLMPDLPNLRVADLPGATADDADLDDKKSHDVDD